MTERIWTRTQYGKLSELQKKYQIPEAVVEEVHRVVDTLDTCYNSDRDVDKEDGGYLILSTGCIDASNFLGELLAKYHVRVEDAELKDTLCVNDGIIWKSVLYLISNDFGITFVFPCREYR